MLGVRGELNRAKYYACAHGLCGEYLSRWDAAKDVGELFALGTDANGAGFVCEALAQPWGWSAEFICAAFSELLNGRHRHAHGRGYSSEVWCRCEEEGVGEIEACASLTMLLACHGVRVHVPKHRALQLYVSGGCDIDVVCDGHCRLYVYGKDNAIRVEGDVRRVDVALPDDGSIRNVGERRKPFARER